MRIAMLSQNDRNHDSRVMREAESLASRGHDVFVICRTNEPERRSETIGNVVYISVPRFETHPQAYIVALVRSHARVLGLMAATRAASTRLRLASAARLVAFGALAPAAGLVLALARLRRGLPTRLLAAHGNLGARYLEALRYLNDFSATCGSEIRQLAPNVIHAHDLITLSAAAIAAGTGNARLVYDAHELETHTNYHSLSLLTKRWIARYEAGLTARADAVVTVCDSIADWLAAEYGIARPVIVLNSPATIKESGRSLRSDVGLPASTPLAVYVGSVTVDRGLENTVASLTYLPEVHFATVGWRYAETERAMRTMATGLGVESRLHLLDPVPSEEVVPYIASADASVIPIQNVCLSYAFCFPNKLLESVFAGVPVAAANLVELRRFLDGHAVGVLMDETQPEAIADAIRMLISSPSAFAVDEDERARIKQAYGWPTQEARLLELYSGLDSRLASQPVRGRDDLTTLAS